MMREMEPSPFTKYQITNLSKLKSPTLRSDTRVVPLSGTVTRVAPLSGTVIKTVLRENHQIALFSASFVPAGASPIQRNSRPVMTRKGLGRLDKDLKTN
ncbi:hypothetical protein DY000_02017539 [Brassica cretica]|uniref:Uncharacterized protein n=1 Tax=Brassica cretica TaxID=69181 RepID=A0ABQ7D471_BRACR|nr:hypothetical protein DY000_02017539 [Brassica cretica]